MICNSNKFSDFKRQAEYQQQSFRFVLCDRKQQSAIFETQQTLIKRQNIAETIDNSCNFEIEVSPLIQITPVSTKKTTVEGMGFFFQFPMKGEIEGRERSKERAIEQQLATSCSSSRGSFFSGYQRTTRTYFNL